MVNRIGPKPPARLFSLGSMPTGHRARLIHFLRANNIQFKEDNSAELDRPVGTFAGSRIEVHLSKDEIARHIFGDRKTPIKEIFDTVKAKLPMSSKEFGLAKNIVGRFGGNLDRLTGLEKFLFGCVDFSGGLAVNFYFENENAKHMEVPVADWMHSSFIYSIGPRSKINILMQGKTHIVYSTHYRKYKVLSLVYNCSEENQLIKIEIKFPSKGRKLVVWGSFGDLPRSDGFYDEDGQGISGTRIDGMTRELVLNYSPPFIYQVRTDSYNPFLLPFDRIRDHSKKDSAGFETAYPTVGDKVIDLSVVRDAPPPGILEAFNELASSGKEFTNIATRMLARRLLEIVGPGPF